MKLIKKMSEEKQYPSVGEQAKNLAKFSWDLIKYIHESNRKPLLVSDELYKERTSVCKGCDKFDDLENKCMECGCYIPAKARIILDSCPLNKWRDLSNEWEETFNNFVDDLKNDSES